MRAKKIQFFIEKENYEKEALENYNEIVEKIKGDTEIS